MSELGLNEHHTEIIMRYLTFTKYQRNQNLKAIDYLFQDVMDSRLLENTFTAEEVTEILEGLRIVLTGEVESGLISSNHMNVLLLQQLFSQAQRWHLRMEANLSELENRELLDKIRQLEVGEMSKSSKGQTHLETIEDEDGPAALLHSEITRLSKLLEEQKVATETLSSQVASRAAEREEMQEKLRVTQELLVAQEECKNLSDVESEVAKLRGLVSNNLEASASSQQKLEMELGTMKVQYEKVQAHLQLAEQELERKFNQTTAFVNLKKMLESKNEQLKDLRAKLAKYEPDEDETQTLADD